LATSKNWVDTTLVNDVPSGAISIARVTRVIPSKTPPAPSRMN